MISRTITKALGVEGTSSESYLYDGLNRLTKGTNDVSVVERRYDSLSRLIEEVQDGKSVQYGYDALGNTTRLVYPNQRVIEREFDLLNRVSRVKQGSDVISTMEFLGRSYRLASKGYQNGDLVKYLYDQGRRLISSETKNKNQVILQSFGWGYDSLDLKSFEKRLHNGGKGDAFSYDALKRLTNVTFDSPTPETPGGVGVKSRAITLDKLDNILKITDNENAMVTEIIGELEGKGKALNQYSRFNDLPLEYDTNGNLSSKGSRLFAYDYRNRLIRSSRGDDAVAFTYDIFGRQTSRTDLSGTQHFFYAGDQKIEERNTSGQVTKHYVWGNGIDELLRLDIYNGSSLTPYYIHTDNIGSTTAVTDGNGNLVERVTYDSYGVPTFTDALGQTLKKSTIRNTTLFQGREYDYDLALYNYRARYFDPTMGRFLQTDPLGYQDSMNLYQGMGMNPVNFLDPMGEEIIVEKHFRSKWKRIKRYLTSKSLLAKKIIDYLELPQYKIYIFDVPEEGANSFVEKEKNHILIYDAVTKKKYEGKDVILINSKTGLRIFDEKTFQTIGYQSVALSLMHELIHAYHQKNNAKEYSRGNRTTYSKSSPLLKWYSLEEKKTVEKESIIAHDLGEVARNYYDLLNEKHEFVYSEANEIYEKVNDVLLNKNTLSKERKKE